MSNDIHHPSRELIVIPRWIVPVAAVLVLGLTSPAIFSGLHLDDWQQVQVLKGEYEFSDGSSPYIEFFTFANGDPEHNRRLIDDGTLPWWTSESLRLRYLRPVSVLTHQLDLWLWPDNWAMNHVHSVVWFLFTVFAASRIYRRCGSTTVGVCLAILFFAIDDVHAMTIAWLANRNHLVAGTLILLAFNAHIRWQQERRAVFCLISTVLFGIAMLAAELGTAFGGLVLAWAVTMHQGTLRQKVVSVLPGLFVGIVWFVSYQVGDFGARSSGQYLDPVGDPGGFLLALVERIPIFFAVFFGLSSADLFSYGDETARWFIWLAAVVAVLVFLPVMARLGWRDRRLRFWFLATLLVMLPICAGNFMDRSLLMASFTAHGLVVRFLELVWQKRTQSVASKDTTNRCRNLIVYALAIQLLCAHAVWPFGLLPLRILLLDNYRSQIESAAMSLDSVGSLQDRDLIIVNPPDTMFAWHLSKIRKHYQKSAPRHIRVLCSALVPIDLKAAGDCTIVVKPQQSFIKVALADLYRSTDLETGWKRSLTGVDIELTDVEPDGAPSQMVFEFDRPLDSPDLAWVEWQDGRFVPFTPPQNGEQTHLTARLKPNWFVVNPIRELLGL